MKKRAKKLYVDSEANKKCNGKYLLLDNDFLSEIYDSDEVLLDFIFCFEKSFVVIDHLTEFEFLRDIYEPKQRKLKELFLSAQIFQPIPNRQETFLKQQENALLLSKVYAHNGQTKGISTVDLFIAARGMLHSSTTYIVTGNKKHFPGSVFDIIGIMNVEQNDGTVKPYAIISFNKGKFDECYKGIGKMEKKYQAQIDQDKKLIDKDNLDDIPF